jgi:hypothetical protein
MDLTSYLQLIGQPGPGVLTINLRRACRRPVTGTPVALRRRRSKAMTQVWAPHRRPGAALGVRSDIAATSAPAGSESRSQMEGFQAEDRHNPLPHIGPCATALN